MIAYSKFMISTKSSNNPSNWIIEISNYGEISDFSICWLMANLEISKMGSHFEFAFGRVWGF